MRASIGLGLIAILCPLACAESEGSLESTSMRTDGPDSTEEHTDPVSPPPSDPPDVAPKDPDDPNSPPAPVLPGIEVTDIAVFQAVKVPVVERGSFVKASSRKAPIVAQRPGLLRVYVTPDDGWTSRNVTAELRLVDGDKKFPLIRETKIIEGASTEEDLDSTFNLEIPAERLPNEVSFQISLTDANAHANAIEEASVGELAGRFPRDGSFEKLGAELTGKVRIVLVPVRYDADGSGRTPAVGPTELDLYKKAMMRIYPTSEVEVKTHAPYPWNSQISANGNGFSSVLRAMLQLRQNDAVDDDVYYYGLLAPMTSMNAYCQRGCVTGLSTIVDDPTSASMRASVGIGFGGDESATTMAHEIGHAHGRQHAPCGGARGTDPSFPYSGGGIGVWGYDIFAKTLISPAKGRDLMGYCPNEWVSDYTYRALFERISTISLKKTLFSATAAPPRVRYRVATVGANGDLAWDGELTLREELRGGAIRHATFLAESGARAATRPARFFQFDHLPGGFVLVPEDASIEATNWKTLAIEGFTQQLAR